VARPTKDAEPGTTVTIGLRVPAELKMQLEERAGANHRNLSQECERRLAHSFDPALLIADALSQIREMDRFSEGSAHLAAMARAIFGEAGTVGVELMKTIAMARMMDRKDAPYDLRRELMEAMHHAMNDLVQMLLIEGTRGSFSNQRDPNTVSLFEEDESGRGARPQGASRAKK
jgi:hypothetical protein